MKTKPQYLWSVCRRAPYLRILWDAAREDVEQIARIVSHYSRGDRRDDLRTFRAELRRLGRELGFKAFFRESSFFDKKLRVPPCVVCGQPGVYVDKLWGRLCRRHGMTVRQRRRRGIDPRRPMCPEKHIRQPKVQYPIPRHNREFWTRIWLLTTPEEWHELWLWADGFSLAPPMQLLQSLRERL